jgi:Uma2 family endonuclease
MSALAHPRLSVEEYLKLDRSAEFKSEFYDGCMYAMSGGSPAHALIIPNVAAELRNALKQRSCTVYVTELRVRVTRNAYTYPDIAVVCGTPRFADDQKDTLINPTLLVEVLSPSTEAHDRGMKFAYYRKLESLQEYALVSQSEPRVEIFRRQSSGDWLLSESVGTDAFVRFESLDCRIALSEIYHQVEFPEQPAA